MSQATSRWRRTLIIQGALASMIAVSIVPLASARVLVATHTFGVESAIYEFDDFGNLQRLFDVVPGFTTFPSIATDGSHVTVARFRTEFREYESDGTYLGPLTGLPALDESASARVEYDARGNLYLLGAGNPRRISPDGMTSTEFPLLPGLNGIDADVAGNVYFSRLEGKATDGIYKYSANGVLQNFTPNGRISEIAIDEAGQALYAAAGQNNATGLIEIMAFDISGPEPSFLRSIPAPPFLAGISFDPHSGNLLATNLFGFDTWEISTDGDVMRKYATPGANPRDVVAIRVPEPATLSMVIAMVALATMHRPRRNHRIE